MKSLMPYDPLTEGVDELFRGFFKPVRWDTKAEPVTIKMDLTETPDGCVVHAEMPGVKKEDIDVAIEGNQVTIAAEVKREAEKKEGDRVLRSERYFGNVYRSFTLPLELDEAKCEATYDKGVLELKLVTKAGTAAKKLEIR
jgi:HSP20 family protein